MTEHIIRVTPIKNPALDRALTKAMKGKDMPKPGSAIPKTKAEFDRMVREAEAPLRAAKRGRPRAGTRGPITRTRSIRAPAALWKRLDAIAKARGVSVNQAAVLALESLAGE